MITCLLCHEPVDARGRVLTLSIPDGADVAPAEIAVCCECAYTRAITVVEICALAWARHEGRRPAAGPRRPPLLWWDRP